MIFEGKKRISSLIPQVRDFTQPSANRERLLQRTGSNKLDMLRDPLYVEMSSAVCCRPGLPVRNPLEE